MSWIKLEKKNIARDRVLEPEEFTWFHDYSVPRLQAINLVAHLMGMRQGEILHLNGDRVDFKANEIRLQSEDSKTN